MCIPAHNLVSFPQYSYKWNRASTTTTTTATTSHKRIHARLQSQSQRNATQAIAATAASDGVNTTRDPPPTRTPPYPTGSGCPGLGGRVCKLVWLRFTMLVFYFKYLPTGWITAVGNALQSPSDHSAISQNRYHPARHFDFSFHPPVIHPSSIHACPQH